ncbi:MAG: hypothetical protein AAFX59_16020, partial [Pseudomonadota bacterium]
MSENNPKTDVDEVLEAVKRLVSAPAANAPAKDLASNHPGCRWLAQALPPARTGSTADVHRGP